MAGWKFFLDGIEVEEPIGWDAVEFTAIRMESHGIDQPFSTELRFYDKGAKYIKSQYDQYFINAEIAITITSDVDYNNQPFQFDGFLNLSVYQEKNVCDTDSWEITVGIIDDNFREKFKARQDVEIDLTTTTDLDGNQIDPLTYKNVRLHIQDIYLTATLSQKESQSIADLTWSYECAGDYGWKIQNYASILPAYLDNSDFIDPIGTAFSPTGILFSYGSPCFVNNSSTVRSISINFHAETLFWFYDIKQGAGVPPVCPTFWVDNPFGRDSATANADMVVAVYDASNTLVSYNLVGSTSLVSSPGNNQIYPNQTNNTWNYSNTFTIFPNHKLFIYMEVGTAGTLVRDTLVTDPVPVISQWYEARWKVGWSNVCLNISEINSGTSASFCNGLTIEQWLRRSIYILTGSNNKLLSNAFSESEDGCYWNNFLTNGLKIRNASTIDQIDNGCNPEENQDNTTKIKTSFKDIFNDLDKIFCLGWAYEWTGTEWKIRIEPREYFYQNQISQRFSNVGEVTQTAKVDKLINNVKIGFNPIWKNIQISGAWAIHTDRNYFIANRAMNEGSTANLDLRANIITEGYAIEFSRRLTTISDGGGSSDRPNDYNIFLIWINRNEITVNPVELSEYKIPGETGMVTFPIGTVSVSSDRILVSNSPIGGLYNIYHTPARVAARWWKVLGMHTYGLSNPIMRFQVGEYQTTYSSAIEDSTEPCIQYPTGYVLPENTDISSSILNDSNKDYLFKPIEVEFSYPQSLCDFLTLSQDEQYRKVRLTSGSLTVEGFILNASNQPEDSAGGTTSFKLLVSNLDSALGGAFNDGFDDGYENGG